MYVCNLCDYITSSNNSMKKHFNSKKHISNINNEDLQNSITNLKKEHEYKLEILKLKKNFAILYKEIQKRHNIT